RIETENVAVEVLEWRVAWTSLPCLGPRHAVAARIGSCALRKPGRGRMERFRSNEITEEMSKTRTLDVGCGINKYPGAIGIDRNPATSADVLCDLDRIPYPFADNSFDQLRAIHVIEHVSDVIRSMEEFHRLVRPGGRIRIETPHYTDFSSFCDPTHRWHLNTFSFRYFGENNAGFGYYSQCKFREI